MQIGRKIYYDIPNGVIVWDKGEMSGDVSETTLEQDEATMPILKVLADKNVLGVLQLAYGQDADKFAACKSYYIDVTSNTVVFLTASTDSTTTSA